MTDKTGPKYPMGKVSRAFFETVIARHLGQRRKDIAVGPANGVDVGVVRLPDGRAMISTTDPIYIVPQYGWERAAWFAFHILASDLTTSGVAPQYITLDWNLPMDIEDDHIETMLRVIDRECKKYGASIVTGHTGRYEGCTYPMVGGATFLAIAPKDGWVTANMARPGNHLLVTKTAALEATAILSNTFPEVVERKLGGRDTTRSRPVRIDEHRRRCTGRRFRRLARRGCLGDARCNGGRCAKRGMGDGTSLWARSRSGPDEGPCGSGRRGDLEGLPHGPLGRD